MAKLKQKQCAANGCTEMFTPRNMQHRTHHYQCAIQYQKELTEKRKAKDKRKAVKDFRSTDKVALRKDIQKIANRLGKLQNMVRGENCCVTCGGYSDKQMDGGHAYPTSAYSPIRYYTLQIRPQCVKCNRFNGGMPKEYREYLIKELGELKVLWLESHKGQITKKFTVEYLRKYKKVMGKRLKRQELLYNKCSQSLQIL